MRYLFGVFFPLIIQVLVVWVTIEMNTGNGSWAGLAALLIGMFAIPATAIVNGIYVKTHEKDHVINVLAWCWVISIITPVAVVIFMMLG